MQWILVNNIVYTLYMYFILYSLYILFVYTYGSFHKISAFSTFLLFIYLMFSYFCHPCYRHKHYYIVLRTCYNNLCYVLVPLFTAVHGMGLFQILDFFFFPIFNIFVIQITKNILILEGDQCMYPQYHRCTILTKNATDAHMTPTLNNKGISSMGFMHSCTTSWT